MAFFFKRTTALLTLLSYFLMFLTTGGAWAIVDPLEIEFFYKEGKASLSSHGNLWLRLKGSDHETIEKPLSPFKEKFFPSERKILESPDYEVDLKSLGKGSSKYQLLVKGTNCQLNLLCDDLGNVKIQKLKSQNPLILLSPGSLQLQACQHKAKSLFLGSPYIYNYGNLTTELYLGLCGFNGATTNILNLPTSRLQCQGKMDVFEGRFKNHGTFIADKNLILDLHGNPFLHHQTEKKITNLSVQGVLQIVNGGLVDLRAPLNIPAHSGKTSLDIQAQKVQGSDLIRAHHISIDSNQLILSKDSLVRGESLSVKSNKGIMRGTFAVKNNVSYQGGLARFHKTSRINTEEMTFRGQSCILEGNIEGDRLNFFAQEKLRQRGTLEVKEKLLLCSFQEFLNVENIRGEKALMSFVSPLFRNQGEIEGSKLLFRSLTSFLNTGKICAQSNLLLTSLGTFENQNLLTCLGGTSHLFFSGESINKGFLRGKKGIISLNGNDFKNDVQGVIDLEASLDFKGRGKLHNERLITSPSMTLEGDINTINKGVFSSQQTFFESPHSCFQNQDGTFETEKTKGKIGSFQNMGTCHAGLCLWEVADFVNTRFFKGRGLLNSQTFNNRGVIEGVSLVLSLQKTGENLGEATLYNIIGSGSFENSKQLSLEKLGVRFFCNKKGRGHEMPSLRADKLVFGSGLQTFINDVDAYVNVSTLSCSPENLDSKTPVINIINRGELISDHFDFDGKVINEGLLKSRILHWQGHLFKIGDLSELVLTKEGTFYGNVVNNSNTFFDEGNLFFSDLTNTQKLTIKTSGKFSANHLINEGTLNFHDSSQIDIRKLTNTKDFHFKNSFGEIELVENHGDVRFQGLGDLRFKDLINEGILQFGIPVLLENLHKYTKPGRFLCDYGAHIPLCEEMPFDSIVPLLPEGPSTLYQDTLVVKKDRVVPFPLSIHSKHFTNEALIQAEPLEIRAEESACNGGTLNSQSGPLSFISPQITKLGTVISSGDMRIETVQQDVLHGQGDRLVPGGTLTLKMPGHILRLKDPLTLKAPFILDAKTLINEKELKSSRGDMIFTLSDLFQNGVSSSLLAQLIVEEGTLFVNGRALHNQYGQIFGQKAIDLTLEEDVINGAGSQKSYAVTGVHYPQHRHFSTPNGSFIASSGDIKSTSQNFHNTFGQVIALRDLTINSENVIENLAGIMRAGCEGFLKGRTFNNTVGAFTTLKWGCSNGRHDLYYHEVDTVTGHHTSKKKLNGKFNYLTYTFPTSSAAIMSSGQNLTLDLSEATLNRGSSIYSGGSILEMKSKIQSESPAYTYYFTRENTGFWGIIHGWGTWRICSGNMGTMSAVVSSAEKMEITLPDSLLNGGYISAPNISIMGGEGSALINHRPQENTIPLVAGSLPRHFSLESSLQDPRLTSGFFQRGFQQGSYVQSPFLREGNQPRAPITLILTPETAQAFARHNHPRRHIPLYSDIVERLAFETRLIETFRRGYLLEECSTEEHLDVLRHNASQRADHSGISHETPYPVLTPQEAQKSDKPLMVYRPSRIEDVDVLVPEVYLPEETIKDPALQHLQSSGSAIVADHKLEVDVDHVHNKGAFYAGEKVDINAEKSLIVEQDVTRVGNQENFQDYAVPGTGVIVTKKKSKVEVQAGKGEFVGARITSGSVDVKTKDPLVIRPQRLESCHKTEESNTQTVNHNPSKLEANESDLTLESEEGVLILQNTHARAKKKLHLRGQEGSHFPTAVNTREHHSLEKSGSSVTGKSRKEEHHHKATHQVTTLEAGEEIIIDGGKKEISLSATQVRAPKKILKAPQGSIKFKAVQDQEFYSVNKSSSSGLHKKSSQLGFKKSTVREFTTDDGEFIFETPHISAELRRGTAHEDTPFIRILRNAGADLTLLDDTYESWHEVQQSAGPLVQIVIAIAMSLVMPGMGTGLAAVCLKAGACSLSSQFLTGMIAHQGDPFASLEDVFSGAGLRRAGISVLSAGVAHGLGETFDVDLAPNSLELTDHIQATLLNTCAQISAETILSGDSFEEILKRNLTSGAAMVVGSYGASRIGQAYKKDELSPFEQKLSHGALGAVAGFIQKGDLEGAFAGAVGAVTGEIAAEEYKQYRKSAHKEDGGDASELQDHHSQVYKDMVEKGVAIAKMTAATAATLLGQDPDVAAFTAANAARHNALQILIGAAAVGSAIYSACEIYETYQEEGAEAALKQAGVEIVIATAGGLAVKGGIKAGQKLYKIGKEFIPVSQVNRAWKAYVQSSPALKSVVQIAEKGVAFTKEVAGKISKKADDFDKGVEAFGQRGLEKTRNLFGASVGTRAAATASNAATDAVNRGANKAPPRSSTSSSHKAGGKTSHSQSSSSSSSHHVGKKEAIRSEDHGSSSSSRISSSDPKPTTSSGPRPLEEDTTPSLMAKGFKKEHPSATPSKLHEKSKEVPSGANNNVDPPWSESFGEQKRKQLFESGKDYKASHIDRQSKGLAGEIRGMETLERAGYKGLECRLPSEHGLDGVFVKYGRNKEVQDIIILESKYANKGRARLSKDSKDVRQMSDEWINKKVKMMEKSKNSALVETAEIIKENEHLVRRKVNVMDGEGVNRWNSLKPPKTEKFKE